MHTGENLAGPASAGLEAGQLRLLAWAALASVALHLLLLYALPILEDAIRAPAAPRLSARLVKPPPPAARAESVPEPRPAPVARPVARPPAVAPFKPAAKPAVAAAIGEAPKPLAEPAPALPDALPAPKPSLAGADPAPAPASAPASAGPDPASVARFRLELMDAARRYKRYPRVALDNNWEGRVELRVAFAETGALASLTVKKGAGRAALDDAAQAMIRSAQAQTPVPPSLRGKAFVLEIPVDFLLRDAER
jgi:protein TonB